LLVGYYCLFVNNLNRDFSEYVTMSLPMEFPYFRISMICETERGMVCLPYNINRENNTVTWKLSRTLGPGEKMPFMLEYYSSPFEQGESKRFKISPVFISDINKVTVDITHPARATDFVMDPVPQKSITKNGSDHSLLYYNNLKAGEPIDLTISYIKNDNKGAVQDNNSMNSNNFQQKAESATSSNTTLFIVIIISIAAVFLGLMIYLSSRNRTVLNRNKGKKNFSRNKKKSSYEAEKNKIRKLLIDGKITEKTYKQLLKDIPGSVR
ncbi:MAG: hypothetical protein L3J12_05825, partial [Spirochaetales bacterium]|nr:hypothetical protein [Spirochaetales bacterium]